MSDLISRKAALDAIDKNRQALLSLGMDGAEHILVHYGRRVIEELPTASEVTLCHLESPCEYQNADIAMPTIDPVKHGRWIHDGKRFESGVDWMHCSECGNTDVFGAKSMYHYCYNCGAMMVEGEEG